MQELNQMHKQFIEDLNREDVAINFDGKVEIIQQYLLSSGFSKNLSEIYMKKEYTIKAAFELSSNFNKFNNDIDIEKFMKLVLRYYFLKYDIEDVAFGSSSETNEFEDSKLSIEFFMYILKILLVRRSDISKFNEKMDDKEYKSDVFEKNSIIEILSVYDYVNKKKSLDRYMYAVDYAHDVANFYADISCNIDQQTLMVFISSYFVGKLMYNTAYNNGKTVYYYSKLWVSKNFVDEYLDSLIDYDEILFEKGKHTHLTIENHTVMYTLQKVKSIKNKVKVMSLDESMTDDNLDIYNKFHHFEDLKNYLESNKISRLEFFDSKHIYNSYNMICIDTNLRINGVFFNEIKTLNLYSTEKVYLDSNNLLTMINTIDEYSSLLNEELNFKTFDYAFNLHKNIATEVVCKAANMLGNKLYFYYQDNEEKGINLFEKYISLLILEYKNKTIKEFHIFLGEMLKSACKHNDMQFNESILELLFSYIGEDTHKNIIIEILCSIIDLKVKYFNEYILEKLIILYRRGIEENSYKLKLTVLYYFSSNINNEKADIKEIKRAFHKNGVNLNFDKYDDESKYLNSTSDNDTNLKFLRAKILCFIENNKKSKDAYMRLIKLITISKSDILSANNREDTFWINKLVNIEILGEIYNYTDSDVFRVTAHLSNILKVSKIYDVRIKAGKTLIDIIQKLDNDEFSEITIDIIKSISVKENHMTDNIAYYIGHILLNLNPRELDECIDDLIITFENSDSKIAIRILKVFTVFLENYPLYESKFYESEKVHKNRLKKIIGLFINGMIFDEAYVRQQSLVRVAKALNNENVTYEEKYNLYHMMAKKVFNVISLNETDKFSVYNNAVALNNFYKFINDKRFDYYNSKNLRSNKIAFFNSSFEEFTDDYKVIIEQILDMDYEIYLNPFPNDLRERTSPYYVRRKKLSRAISDDLNVYVFPRNIFINLNNNSDLLKLRSFFPDKEVSLVVGLDSFINSKLYYKKQTKNSIHSFNHIFYDDLKEDEVDSEIKVNNAKNKINGNIVNILSSKVRNDYEKKESVEKLKCVFEIIEDFSKSIVDEIGKYVFMYTNLLENVGEAITAKKIKFCVMRENNASKKIIGFSAFHMIDNKDLYREFRDVKVAEYIRSQSSGKIMIINGIFISERLKDVRVIRGLLNETFRYALSRDYSYAVYKNTLLNYDMEEVYEELKLFGFKNIDKSDGKLKIYTVSMKSPIVFICDIEKFIMPEFIDESFLDKLEIYRNRIKNVLTKFYPNNLVLSLEQGILEKKMVAKILASDKNIKKSNSIFVTNSGLFMNEIIEDIVMFPLNMERKMNSNMDKIEYGAKYKELDMISQFEHVKSFDRPVVLLNSVIDDSREFENLYNRFNSKEIFVEKYFSAILSGRGRDLMDYHNLNVESIYFIPNMKLIFREENLYPFIGGISINNEDLGEIEAIPSINEILPYTAPLNTEDVDIEIIFEFSKVCLENDADLMKILQNDFINKYNRRLNYTELENVFKTPRLPYKGEGVRFDMGKDISTYILDEKESLNRLKKLIKR